MKRLVFVLLFMLMPAVLCAGQIGIKVGGFKFAESQLYGYKNDLAFGLDVTTDEVTNIYVLPSIRFRFDLNYYSNSFNKYGTDYKVSRTEILNSVIFSFSDGIINPYIGCGIGLFLIDEQITEYYKQYYFKMDDSWHGLGTVVLGGIEAELNDIFSVFIEYQLSIIEKEGIDLGGRSVYIGTRLNY